MNIVMNNCCDFVITVTNEILTLFPTPQNFKIATEKCCFSFKKANLSLWLNKRCTFNRKHHGCKSTGSQFVPKMRGLPVLADPKFSGGNSAIFLCTYLSTWQCCHICLFSLKASLETLGVLRAMKTHASAFKTLTLENLFVPQLSPPGSNQRSVENRVYAWWLDLLQDMSGYCLQKMLQHHLISS